MPGAAWQIGCIPASQISLSLNLTGSMKFGKRNVRRKKAAGLKGNENVSSDKSKKK